MGRLAAGADGSWGGADGRSVGARCGAALAACPGADLVGVGESARADPSPKGRLRLLVTIGFGTLGVIERVAAGRLSATEGFWRRSKADGLFGAAFTWAGFSALAVDVDVRAGASSSLFVSFRNLSQFESICWLMTLCLTLSRQRGHWTRSMAPRPFPSPMTNDSGVCRNGGWRKRR